MASQESTILTDLYRDWAKEQAARPDMTIEETRRMFDSWGNVTAEPKEVDYIEVDLDGVLGMWIKPHDCSKKKVILCAHGGGYVGGSIYTHRKMFGHLAKKAGCLALSVDYSLAPEFPHPAPVNDMVKVYRWLLQHGFEASDIALAGDSAGGSLSLTTVEAARREGLPLPAAVMSMSPWAGADTSAPSYELNKDKDVLITRAMSEGIGGLFLGENGSVTDALANPLHIDFRGFPPIFFQVGSYEAVLDDAVRPANNAKAAGVDVRIEVFPEMQHCFQMLAGTAPEGDEAIRNFAEWVKPHLGM